MTEVAGLALPFFGLIFLGFLAGRIWRRSEAELAWLNIFVIYFALPAMFFQLLAKTPVEELANGSFVFATVLATCTAFALCFTFAFLRNGGNIAEATMQGLIGGYGNIGYMGPPLALVALGPAATIPTALIFCFDIALIFTLTPLMMAFAGTDERSLARTLLEISRKVLLHPFIVATLIGIAAAALGFRPPAPVDRLLDILSGAAAPCALFALGVTVASRRLQRVPTELPVLILVKLAVHPALVFVILSWIGGIDRIWVETAVLMACLPPAATVYIIATQYQTYVLRGSSAILLGTLASVFTVTVVLYIVTNDLLPWAMFETSPTPQRPLPSPD